MNEDVFTIEHGNFQLSHASLQEAIFLDSLGEPSFHCGQMMIRASHHLMNFSKDCCSSTMQRGAF